MFKKQIELFPDSPANVYYMLGLTYGYSARGGKSQDWINAEKYFREDIVRAPSAVWPRIDLGWVLFAQGKFEEMKPLVVEGLKLEPNNPWLHNMYGLALLNTGEKAKANEEFLLAQKETKALTPEEWGSSYPGNDPLSWEVGLREMQKSIDHNVLISR